MDLATCYDHTMMDESKLPTLGQTLKAYNLLPDKRMGQNFILQPGLLSKIVSFTGDLKDKHVVEIGAGPGGLTRALLQTNCAQVTAIEMDDRCMPVLKDLQQVFPNRPLGHPHG